MEKYEFLSRTGEGAYGSVWRARDKNTGLLVAVKKMKDTPTSEEEAEIAMREVRVLQLAKHVNVVNLLEAYKSQSGRLYLVFEYVERTLLQELKSHRGGMPVAAVKSITWQLLQSLSYLHRKQILHRDVKPSNILLTDGGAVKMCDFGFARNCASSANDPAYTTYVVTRWYRPPEVLVGDTYGPPVDVWALGCIFAEMLVGRPLFPGKNHHDQLWLILKCLGTCTERQLELLDADPQFACFRLPTVQEVEPLEQRLPNVGGPAMQFLRACLNPDPRRRATADELLALPYLQGASEVLPLDELFAYPDPEMHARLERAIAADQAAAAAAAAARENLLAMPLGKRALAPSNRQPQPHAQAHHQGLGPASPTRGGGPAHERQRQAQQDGGGAPLPSKAASVPRIELGGGTAAAAERPPLHRHITAPAGSLSMKLQPQPPLQPLPENSSSTGLQRSRPGSGSSHRSLSPAGAATTVSGAPALPSQPHQQSLPAYGLAGARHRAWRASGDGETAPHMHPHSHLHPHAGPPGHGHGAPHQVSRQLSSTLPAAAPAGASGRSPPRPARAAQQGVTSRTTWSGGGGSGLPAAQASPFSSNTGSAAYAHPGAVNEVVGGMAHRKTLSMAGNETLPQAGALPAGRSTHTGLQGGVQGRSLAPQPGAQLQPMPVPFGFPPHGSGLHRLSPSPPPGTGYTLRGTVSAPLQPGQPHRPSHDGMGMSGFVPGPLAAAYGFRPSQQQQQQYQVQQVGNGSLPGGLDAEPSEMDGGNGEGAHNDGRRASDTVLYAAAAIKEAKARLDKASNIIAGNGRTQGLLDSTVAAALVNGPSGNGNGFASIRVPSFSRSSGSAAATFGPSSPDAGPPTSLPPLLGTPRRISAPEPTTGSMVAAAPSGAARTAPATSHPPSGNGYLQRHNIKQQHHQQHQQQHSTANGYASQQQHLLGGGDGAADGPDAAAHMFLPSLDVGGGKGARAGQGANIARRPSKGCVRPEPVPCKRDEGANRPVSLEAVPEAGLL